MSNSKQPPDFSSELKLLEVSDDVESLEWLSATLRSIGDAVIATTAEAEPRILFMNAVAETLTGWSLDEARGRCVLKTFHIINQKTRQKAVNPIERVIREGITVGLANHTALIAKNGEERVIEDSAAPIRDKNGKISGVVLVFRDVTDKARAEEQAKALHNGRVLSYVGANTDVHDQKIQADELEAAQTRLNLAMQSAKISTWHIDLETNSTESSKDTAAKFGLDHMEGDVLQIIATMMHPDDRERIEKTLQKSIASKTDYFDEYRIKTVKGDTRWVRVSGRIHEMGGRPFMSGIAMDITEEKLRVQQVEEAKRLAEAASQAKSAFLANMSHEIRTPLGAIIGFSELLREPDLSPEEKEQYLETVIRSGHGLTRIIDDILDLAKVEAGRLDIEEIEFSLFDFMQEVLDLFRDKARQKGIYLFLNIEDNVPPHVISDPTRLRQILVNLIGNALKFTTKGGVRVNVKSAHQDQEQVELVISVKDTGIGLTASQQEKLFEPFVQADNSTTRNYGGTGLGLVLSRRLAHALGGNITISECKEGLGCTFILSVPGALPPDQNATIEPVRDVEFAPLPEASSQNLRLSRIKVLLADDSIDNQFLIARVLRKHGAAVEIANDGEEAIRKALDSEFDLVLMDIQMPRVDGYEATRALRSNGYKKPIVALTAHAMAEERVRTRAAGCTGHLTKPINQPELIDTIEYLALRLRSASAHDRSLQ